MDVHGARREPKVDGIVKRPHVLDFAYACLVFYWFLSVVGNLWGYVAKPVALAFSSAGSLKLGDFLCFYEAGRICLSAEHLKLYDYGYQLRVLNDLIAPLTSNTVFAIPYPPTAFLLFTPLAVLPLESSFRAFIVLSIVLGAVSLLALAAVSHPRQRIFAALFLMGVFVSIPAQVTFHLGQITWILLGLLTVYCLCLRQGRDIAAGVALGLLFVKPQYALFLVIPPMVCRRWKVVLAALAVLAALGVVAVVHFGIASLTGYPAYLLAVASSSKYFGMFPQLHVNLRAFMSMFLSDRAAMWLGAILFALGLAWVVWLWRKFSRPGECWPQDWLLACTISSALCFSLHSHYYDSLLLAVAAGLTLPTLSPTALYRLPSLPFRIWCLILVLFPLLGFVDCLLSPWLPNARCYTHMVANILLLAAGMWRTIELVQAGGLGRSDAPE
jgi:hypothetical protein